jgi:putative membrane protein
MILTELSTSLMAFAGGWWILSGPLFWLLLIVGIVLVVRGRSGRSPWTAGGRETGIDVLERRFAEGELSLEQYRERRSVLEEKR